MSENLMKSLEITLKGMVAIFIAMGTIFVFVYFFNKLMNIKPEDYAEVDNKDLFAKIALLLSLRHSRKKRRTKRMIPS